MATFILSLLIVGLCARQVWVEDRVKALEQNLVLQSAKFEPRTRQFDML